MPSPQKNKKDRLVAAISVCIVLVIVAALVAYFINHPINAATVPGSMPAKPITGTQTIKITSQTTGPVDVGILAQCWLKSAATGSPQIGMAPPTATSSSASQTNPPTNYQVFRQLITLDKSTNQDKATGTLTIATNDLKQIQTKLLQLQSQCQPLKATLLTISLADQKQAQTTYGWGIPTYTLDLDTGGPTTPPTTPTTPTVPGAPTTYSCPVANTYINCMPCISTPDTQKQCQARTSYCHWVKQNCPNVKIAS